MRLSVSKLLTARRPLLALFFLFGVYGSFFTPSQAQAQLRCQSVFQKISLPQGQVRTDINRSDLNIQNYQTHVAKIQNLLQTLPPDQAQQIKHVIGATEFFDYQHLGDRIFADFISGQTGRYDFSRIYDDYMSQNGLPFNNYVSTRAKLLNDKPEITPNLLLQIHRDMMAGGVENVPVNAMGRWREVAFIGNVTGEFKITPAEKKAIEENPYLKFEESLNGRQTRYNVFWNKIKVSIFGEKKGLNVEDDVLISGRILYPRINNASEVIIAKIESLDPAFAAEIRDYQAQNIKPMAEKEARFTELLVIERFNRFNAARRSLGAIKIGENEKAYIKLVADFQRDLVAIHPLHNGNGRSTRLFLNYLLMKEGLPPVRLVDPMADIQSSAEKWQQMIQQGVEASANFTADIKSRIELGLPLQNSAEIIFPGLPGQISIGKKSQGSEKYTPNVRTTNLDHDQFTSFVKTLTELHPELTQQIRNDRIRTMSRLAELFQEFFQSKTIRFMHEKDGDQQIALRLIDEDFIYSFGRSYRANQSKWNQKISRWYDSKHLVWRGLSDRQHEYSTQDLLRYFTNPSHHLLSNSSLRKTSMSSDLLRFIKDDFRKYNKDLLTGDLIQMAVDHHRSGPLYGQSYGFSTSKREVVGKAFAMGAMVIGTYGEHHDPALQAKLKSRINVAMYRANKDVDLGRLKAFAPEFSYVYGRQAEVMGIGGVDPDAVMLIQRLDAAGEVISTLYRNPDKPSEVLEIKGRFVPGEGELPADKIIQRHSI